MQAQNIIRKESKKSKNKKQSKTKIIVKNIEHDAMKQLERATIGGKENGRKIKQK